MISNPWGPVEFNRAKESRLWQSIKAENADELAAASPLEKLKIKFQMQREFHQRKKELHKPSAGTLW